MNACKDILKTNIPTENLLPINSLKSILIPYEWKKNIDEILKKELMSPNRSFAKSSPILSKLIERESWKIPIEFNSDLIKKWNWHNHFYENLLEPALSEILKKSHFELSPKNVELIKKIYMISSLVDMATLVSSGAIKSHVNYWSEHLAKKMMLSNEETLMLISIPVESFYVKYAKDHLEYLLHKHKSEDIAKQLKKELMEKYHANDEIIFKSRLDKMGYSSLNIETIEKKIKEISLPTEYKIKHFYFTLERPWIKALRDTLIFDNCDEYEILYSLKGISGFILRKKTLEYLNNTKILTNSGEIYGFSDDEIINSLDKLKRYREDVMFKDVIPYSQTELTCSAVCLMMTKSYFGLGNNSKKTEMEIHNFSKSNFLEGEHFSGIALYAVKSGLEAKLMHSEKEMFRFEDSLFDKKTYDCLMSEYHNFLLDKDAKNICIENECDINSNKIKDLLKDDYLVLTAGKYGNILHTLLATGYNSQGLIVIDPLGGKRKVMSYNYMDKFMETPIGKWILAIKPNSSFLNGLIKSIDGYTLTAQKYLKQ